MTTPKPKLVAFAPNARTLRDILRLASPRCDVLVQHSTIDALQSLKNLGAGAILVAEHLSNPRSAGAAGSIDTIQLFKRAAAEVQASHRVVLGQADELLSLITLQHSNAVHCVLTTPIVPREFLPAVFANGGDQRYLDTSTASPILPVATPVPIARVHRAPAHRRAHIYGGAPRR